VRTGSIRAGLLRYWIACFLLIVSWGDQVEAETAGLRLPDGDWVDDLLLTGPEREECLHYGRPVDRAQLRGLVAERQERLAEAGLRAGGTVALRLPPSLGYVATLLAAWRSGAQVALLDHRLTQHEVDIALGRLLPQFVVQPATAVTGPLRGFFDVDEAVHAYPGREAATGHSLIQLSSGSTGPSKIIGRSAADLVAELARYEQVDGFPRRGARTVVLASTTHVLGLVGGLLHALHAGVPMTVPARLTVDGILRAVAADDRPTTLIGVPSQAEVLASAAEPPPLPQLDRMITGGELVRPALWERFTTTYRAALGNMYGMTEVGVIATDVTGEHRPTLVPAAGMEVRVADGEVLLGVPASPYVGLSDPTRWVDGWLHTRDAGRIEAGTGRLVVLGRLDSQVSVGGLKVDLTEVERTLAGLPGVEHAVVVFDGVIKAYVTGADSLDPAALGAALEPLLAAYKRPRGVHVLAGMPRTTSGKLVRDPAALRTAAGAGVLTP
jgi:acyl-coenzyme A synthetase/AMP-(fatty) acid ligase